MSERYFQRLLVISDNIPQCRRLHALLAGRSGDEGGRYGDKSLSVTWACSPFSDPALFSRETGTAFGIIDLRQEADVAKIIAGHDLVLSMHCKQLFPEALVRQVRCINVHPGYNPVNRGWYPQVFAIIRHTLIGATIHEMDKDLDNGPIIARREVPQYASDTSKEIYDRVLDAEMQLLEENLATILTDSYETILPEEKGELYLKKDFRALCEIDPEETGRFGDLIDRLRALTHAPYKNAWFRDPATGEKIFISIALTPEHKPHSNG